MIVFYVVLRIGICQKSVGYNNKIIADWFIRICECMWYGVGSCLYSRLKFIEKKLICDCMCD